MKLCILRLGVYLLASAELPAQSGYQTMAPPNTLLWQLSAKHPDVPVTSRPDAAIHADGRSIVSLSELQHSGDKRAQQFFKKGMREYARHNYAGALPLLQQAAEYDPRSWLLENNLGVAYCALGQDKAAQEAFLKAAKSDPGVAISFTNLAAVSFNTYQYRAAEYWARRALRLAPLNAEARVMLGLALVAQDHWTAEARQYLKENRTRFYQARMILARWPQGDVLAAETAETIYVQGAGPGAFAKTMAPGVNK